MPDKDERRQKPVDVYQFMHVIKSIDEFFVSIVPLPSR
jgi:hypothetical protein